MAGELHDGVTQVLYSIGMQAQAAMLRTGDDDSKRLLGSVGDLASRGSPRCAPRLIHRSPASARTGASRKRWPRWPPSTHR